MPILLILFSFIGFPTIYNIYLFFKKPLEGRKKLIVFALEFFYIFLGAFFSLIIGPINLRYDWYIQIFDTEKHTPIYYEAFTTFAVIISIAIIGYILLRLLGAYNMPPLCAVLCMSAIYLGIIECILWCVQISSEKNFFLFIFPINLIILFLRTIRDVVLLRKSYETTEKRLLGKLFSTSKNWPWAALVLATPLLGIILTILIPLGQKPDYILRMWTETADWTMSVKIPPESIPTESHYLCTVAAGGHRKIVKPLRTGIRHGHKVLVNRQLMIANAFEQLIEERTPRFHRIVRGTYDKLGYPIAKHIRSPYMADIIYFIMKPLEWLFLIILYTFDKKPENRIAVQYPHSEIPQIE